MPYNGPAPGPERDKWLAEEAEIDRKFQENCAWLLEVLGWSLLAASYIVLNQ